MVCACFNGAMVEFRVLEMGVSDSLSNIKVLLSDPSITSRNIDIRGLKGEIWRVDRPFSSCSRVTELWTRDLEVTIVGPGFLFRVFD